MGTTIFKTANSLWKTGQKKVQKAVAEFQQDGDPNQPRWMRSAGQDHAGGGRQAADVTAEAMRLEAGGRPERKAGRLAPEQPRDRSPALPLRPGQGSQAPKWQQQVQPAFDPRSRLNKLAAEEESPQAYISPARRKKATPQPQPQAKPPAEPEPDLLFGSAIPPASRTTLPTGEPRQAVDDADAALALIGPGKGEGEHVELPGEIPGGTEKRDMRDLYGKALSRKAEALEQMEKWSDAGAVWQLCVEAGLGGATAAAGRQRCQNALAPKKQASPTPRPKTTTPRPQRPVRPSAVGGTAKSSEAVERLRAAHKAQEREGDEKIALTDQVDARIAAWRDGKRDNLRALLTSLDSVLWEGSGWKKVGLHELVVANKVKIVYMKAIAKTHPDKIAQDATTEVRMIAGTVFSTLNEAWDKFKAENGM
ncbi:auxilin-like clathrin-binding protein required for normal clathrin function [Collariella sp. IMI 366227]|nr:auxilin-like clathrin-binding protein required for normal clathrin function [Collariella sp. IMI 366227]